MSCNHIHNTEKYNKNKKRILITLFFTIIYMFAEAIGGYISNSLALLADAGHMLSDVTSLTLSFLAIFIATKKSGSENTFGYYRIEILAAFINSIILIVLAVIIFQKALERLQNPQQIQGWILIVIAIGGLIINIIGLLILHKGKSENLNIKGAWLHVLMDTFSSISAALSGILILNFNWYFFDPIASIIISFLVIYSAYILLKETINILMENSPKHIDTNKVYKSILNLNSVTKINDLHIWSITSGMNSLSCSIVVNKILSNDQLLQDIHNLIKNNFDIKHITIQIEYENFTIKTDCIYKNYNTKIISNNS